MPCYSRYILTPRMPVTTRSMTKKLQATQKIKIITYYVIDKNNIIYEDINECPKKGIESEWYCDVWGHENIKLINDGEGGWYCDECDVETDSDSDDDE